MDNSTTQNNELVSAVGRTMAVLEALAEHPEESGVSEIAQKLDMSKSTVYRFLQSLKARGYVVQDAEDRYRLSVLLQLGTLIGAAPALYPAGSQIELQTVGTRDAPLWVFTVVGDETLTTPAGSTEQAVRLERAPTGPWEPRLEVWLGRSLDYLPLRVRASAPDGTVTDQQLSEAVVAGRNPPASAAPPLLPQDNK